MVRGEALGLHMFFPGKDFEIAFPWRNLDSLPFLPPGEGEQIIPIHQPFVRRSKLTTMDRERAAEDMASTPSLQLPPASASMRPREEGGPKLPSSVRSPKRAHASTSKGKETMPGQAGSSPSHPRHGMGTKTTDVECNPMLHWGAAPVGYPFLASNLLVWRARRPRGGPSASWSASRAARTRQLTSPCLP